MEAQTKLSTQGQVSVPSEVRKLLHLRPGSVITWRQVGKRIVVERAARHVTADVHAALFPQGAPGAATLSDLKEGIRQHLRRRHAGG
jgi:antitoxin PrlF